MGLSNLPGAILNRVLSPKSLIAIGGLSGYENYKEKLKESGEKMSMTNAYEHFGKPGIDLLIKTAKGFGKGITGKNMGGMMNARKKNMGLKMADGGEAMKGFSMLPESVQEKMNSVKAKKYNKGGPVKKMGGGMMKYKKGGSVSKSKKPRGTGIAIKGTKFKGIF